MGVAAVLFYPLEAHRFVRFVKLEAADPLGTFAYLSKSRARARWSFRLVLTCG